MTHFKPTAQLSTHEVTNQPSPLENYNLYELDHILKESVQREGPNVDTHNLSSFGHALGRADTLRWAEEANRHLPVLRTHDRYGHRVDEVDFHPAYHHLMSLATEHRQASIAWIKDSHQGHLAHCALEYMMHQIDAGVCCPLSMTYACIPALMNEPDVADTWVPRLLSDKYDPAFLPADKKTGATIGMAMTEKQGGSDVRSNSTKATPLDQSRTMFELVGHKWFCSAPMCDAFLTLAYTDKGLTCFIAPRWTPEGQRNRIFIQRLKDKLGNKSNASSEIEYHNAWAQRVGEEGRGVNTILEMVHHTRLDCTVGAASLMRAGLVQAIHHCTHRMAFQKKLVDQPLMQNVLADLALEVEAATALTFRIARAFDAGREDQDQRTFARLAVAISKYWLNKRVANFIYEALECHGGAGYVEEGPMPRLYREAPLNSIWEGSGNVICLDVVRTLEKEPNALEILMTELTALEGQDARYDRNITVLKDMLHDTSKVQTEARRFVETAAITLQANLLMQHAPNEVSDAFLASRVDGDWGHAYGTLPTGTDHRAIISRAWKI